MALFFYDDWIKDMFPKITQTDEKWVFMVNVIYVIVMHFTMTVFAFEKKISIFGMIQ